jgi:hypothetical protein
MSTLAFEVSENAPPVCLFTENPNRLVSLWDMLKKFEVNDLLRKVRDLHHQTGLIFDSKRGPEYRDEAIRLFVQDLRAVEEICRSMELPMSALHASQLVEACAGPAADTLDRGMAERVSTMLSVTIENETSLRLFFSLSAEKAKYYSDSPRIFDDAVADSFSSSSFDASEASRCFALGRNTACVFHLMRVLEIGLTVFANRFNVPSGHTNWHNIIEGIEKGVRNMANDPNKQPDWKDEQEFFSQAASHFMFVKDAWRNYTAHARGKYDDNEAETIFINVRGFMQKLATKLHE